MALTFPAKKHLNSEASFVSCVQAEKFPCVTMVTSKVTEHFTINSLDLQKKEQPQDTDYNTRKKTQTRIKVADLTDFFKGCEED